ncbi:MAG TPA: GDSL-type esterase/lipase family protein [Gemmatimonadales bacterium]|nr:GDSL-type esterase/lipase family protein [Gemmatimonadales bacterium]
MRSTTLRVPLPLAVAVAAALASCAGDPTGPAPPPATLAAPTDLATHEVQPGDVEVTWRDNSPDERFFEVQRSSTGATGGFSALATVPANTSLYEDVSGDRTTDYCYRVRAVGGQGVDPSPYSQPACNVPNPPPAPTELSLAPRFGQIDLTWKDNATTEARFEVWRSSGSETNPFSLVMELAPNQTTYSNTGLSPGARFCYRVRAVGAQGQASEYTASVCADVPVPPSNPPVAPSQLTAAATSPSTIALAWVDNSSDEGGFEIWRATAGPTSAYSLLRAIGAGVVTATDEALAPATQYCYQVRAIGGDGVPPSDFSPAACATTESPPPATPTALEATAADASRIQLVWQDRATDEGGYELWRSTSGPSGGFSLRTSLPPGSTEYLDVGLQALAQYCYKVRATGVGSAPDSPFSTVECAETPAAVRIVTFGDSNTDSCKGEPGNVSSYVSTAPRLAPDDPHRPCQVAGKIEAKWSAMRSETFRAVNHGIVSTTTGTGRSNLGSPNARTLVNGVTRFEAEVLGRGYPWSGAEPTNQWFPSGGVVRENAYTPGADDYVYVSLGTNDVSAGISPAQTEVNLRWMVQRWLEAGHPADHFIITTLPPRPSATSSTMPDRNSRIRALAGELGLHLIDLAAFLSDDNGLSWRSDALHVGDALHYVDSVRDWLASEVVAWMVATTGDVS